MAPHIVKAKPAVKVITQSDYKLHEAFMYKKGICLLSFSLCVIVFPFRSGYISVTPHRFSRIEITIQTRVLYDLKNNCELEG